MTAKHALAAHSRNDVSSATTCCGTEEPAETVLEPSPALTGILERLDQLQACLDKKDREVPRCPPRPERGEGPTHDKEVAAAAQRLLQRLDTVRNIVDQDSARPSAPETSGGPPSGQGASSTSSAAPAAGATVACRQG